MSLAYFRNIPMYIYNAISLENFNRPVNYSIVYKSSILEKINLYGAVLFYVDETDFKDFIQELWNKPLFDVHKIIVISNFETSSNNFLEKYFKFIHGAGGIVRKEDLILFEERNNVWDLPKGHVEEGESIEDAAVREVFEECGVKCKILTKFLSTLHTVMENQEICFKYVNWFIMKVLDDEGMAPQKEEGIVSVQWIPITEISKKRMYSSIIHLLNTYLNVLPLDYVNINKK